MLQPKFAEPGSEYYISNVETKFQVRLCVKCWVVSVCECVCVCVCVCVHMLWCIVGIEVHGVLSSQPVIPFEESPESMQLHQAFCEVR